MTLEMILAIAGKTQIPAALPEGIDLMVETISYLLGRFCGMLLAGKIISAVGAKERTSLDTI